MPRKNGATPKPKRSASPSPDRDCPAGQLRCDRAALTQILSAAIEANVGVSGASIGYYGLLRELEVCINGDTVPTEGDALDVDHATAAPSYDVFVCCDRKLQDT